MTWTGRVLQVCGALLVCLVLADVFFTVLFPASGHGPIRRTLSRLTWWLFGTFGRRLPRPGRRRLLAYSGPVQITVTMLVWILLLVVGWALVFQPALGHGIVASSGPTNTGWVTALYFSGFSLTTLGTGDVVPVGASYRLFSITEAAIGFSVVTLALTYFLSVYGAITSRKTFASSLHHRTYGTATAVQFLVGLADEGALPQAGQQLSHLSDFLTETYETHHAYPVLHHFHFRDVRYALPQLLLIALDVAALVRTGLDRDRYPGLVRSTAVYQVATAALELLDELQPRAHEDEPPSVATERCWEERFARAVDELQAAGLRVAPDRQAGTRRYLALRRRWDGPLHQLADAMLYDWAEIEPPP